MCTGAQWLDAVRKTMWMWTGAMWAWALLEVVTALKDFTDCGSQCTDILIVGTTVGTGHVVGLWFLVIVPLVGAKKVLERCAEQSE